jgi:hypothetical protein
MGNRLVDKMSLNGWTSSSLIDLAPEVLLAPSNFDGQEQFNVNGKPTDANYFLVDGVSSNLEPGGGRLEAGSYNAGGSSLVSE